MWMSRFKILMVRFELYCFFGRLQDRWIPFVGSGTIEPKYESLH